jgi:1,4-alpha-glucan branching enzyme
MCVLDPGARRDRGKTPGGSSSLIKVAKPTSTGTVRVTFVLPAAEPAGAVSVVGDFNDWNPYAHPLRKRANGVRSAVVTLPAGTTLRFRYLAEGGVWFDDDTAEVLDGQGATMTVPG